MHCTNIHMRNTLHPGRYSTWDLQRLPRFTAKLTLPSMHATIITYAHPLARHYVRKFLTKSSGSFSPTPSHVTHLIRQSITLQSSPLCVFWFESSQQRITLAQSPSKDAHQNTIHKIPNFSSLLYTQWNVNHHKLTNQMMAPILLLIGSPSPNSSWLASLVASASDQSVPPLCPNHSKNAQQDPKVLIFQFYTHFYVYASRVLSSLPVLRFLLYILPYISPTPLASSPLPAPYTAKRYITKRYITTKRYTSTKRYVITKRYIIKKRYIATKRYGISQCARRKGTIPRRWNQKKVPQQKRVALKYPPSSNRRWCHLTGIIPIDCSIARYITLIATRYLPAVGV